MGVRLSIEGSESISYKRPASPALSLERISLMIPMQDLRIWGQRY